MSYQADFQERLEALAYAKTHPFCYSCYKRAPSGTCEKCHSDDLMRELPGVGVEYGTDWIVEHLIDASDLTPIDVEEHLDQSIRDCYGDRVKVGFLELDTVYTIKEMDPVAWRCALADEESNLLDSDNAVSFDNGSTLYWTHDVEAWLDDEEAELAS